MIYGGITVLRMNCVVSFCQNVSRKCEFRITPNIFVAGYVDCTNFTGLNGIYQVNISGEWSPVYCDLLTPGGGWLVKVLLLIRYFA